MTHFYLLIVTFCADYMQRVMTAHSHQKLTTFLSVCLRLCVVASVLSVYIILVSSWNRQATIGGRFFSASSVISV